MGPGRFGATYTEALAPGRYDPGLSAHNLYLELAATTGVMGLAAFLALMALIARQFVLGLTSGPREAVCLAAGLGVLGAILAHGISDYCLDSHAVSLTFW